jgi:hypothetical protein
MVDRGANIDVVFRNGLKDFEVLPPAEVWDNIQPGIKARPKSYLLLKSAASVALIASLGLTAILVSKSGSKELNSTDISFSIESQSPINFVPQQKTSLAVLAAGEKSVQAQRPDLILSKAEVNENIQPLVTNQEENDGSGLLIPSIKDRPEEKQSAPSVIEYNGKKSFSLPGGNIKLNPLNTEPPKQKNWSVAALASPTYYSKSGSGGSDVFSQYTSSEKPAVSYTGGVSFSYKLSKRFSIQSGMYYSSVGQVLEGVKTYTGFAQYQTSKGGANFTVVTSNGLVLTKNNDVYLTATNSSGRVQTNYTKDIFDPKQAALKAAGSNLRQNFNYIEVPVLLRYKVIDKALDFNLVGGVSYNLLVNNNVFTIVDGSKYSVGETDDLNHVILSSSVGMGMEYSLTQNLSLNLEPTLRYYLSPFSGTTSTNVHPYSFGVFSGISYRF